MIFEKVTLPTYTKGEEIFNSVSHGAGILFGIFTMIFCILNSTTPNGILGSVVFALSSIILYSSSTLYHALTIEKVKKVFRLIDHSVIFIMITGTTLAINIISVYPHNKVLSLISAFLGLAGTVTGIAMTFIDQEKYKNVQLVLYVVVAFTSLLLAHPLFVHCDEPLKIVLLVFGGGAVYGIGMVFYIVGKKKKYFHSIFHLFVLAGTIFHFFAIVTAL